jgi:peptide deformylase
MRRLPVVQFPDPVLSKPTAEVGQIGPEERALIADMIVTMHAEGGVGLAANQVGVSKRIFVASADGVKGKELVFVNPAILHRAGEIREFEGCLSVPQTHEPVRRFREVTLRAQNIGGEWIEVKATGLLARIFQHETDHLDGVIFVDRLGWLKKTRVLDKLKRLGAGQKDGRST